MVRNLKLLFTLLVFSITTVVGTEATLPLGQAYHAGQVNPFVHKVLHGGIGAGTAAISGGNVWAGAAGAVAGEVAGQFYLGTQTPTLQNTNHLTRQASNIGRVAGGLAGLVAGRDPNTGANTGTIASENNAAVGILIPAVPAAVETTIAGLGAAGRACMANPTCAAAVRNAASYLIPDIVAKFQGQSGNAQVQPAQEVNNQQAPQAEPPPPEPENDNENKDHSSSNKSPTVDQTGNTQASMIKSKPEVKQKENVVIGRTADLETLKPGEKSLLDLLPDLGSPKSNWFQNSRILREAMRHGKPIRDASPNDTRGIFLNAERNLLKNNGWNFNAETNYWMPPKS